MSYLDWLIGQDFLKGDLKRAIEDHLNTRAGWKRMETEA